MLLPFFRCHSGTARSADPESDWPRHLHLVQFAHFAGGMTVKGSPCGARVAEASIRR